MLSEIAMATVNSGQLNFLYLDAEIGITVSFIRFCGLKLDNSQRSTNCSCQ